MEKEQKAMEIMSACRLCGSHNIVDIGKVNGFTLAKCNDCTLVFIREILNDEYIANVYTLSPEQNIGYTLILAMKAI